MYVQFLNLVSPSLGTNINFRIFRTNSVSPARPRSAGGMKPRPKTIHVDGDDTDLGRATILIFTVVALCCDGISEQLLGLGNEEE